MILVIGEITRNVTKSLRVKVVAESIDNKEICDNITPQCDPSDSPLGRLKF